MSKKMLGVGLWVAAMALGAMTGCSGSSSGNSGSNEGTPPGSASATPPATGSQSTLYSRLGEHAGIRTAVNAVVAAELKDPEIAPLFADVGMPGHPTADQIEECFTNLLGNAASGPEQYPTMADGFQCRDMRAAHATLHISGAIFDKFVMIAAGVLKSAGVDDADLQTVGGALNNTKPDVTDPNAT
jgi:truncated hemoglobin YjbI